MNIGDTKFSICTGVKDRNEYLLQAIPSWLKLPATEIVIIDWSSKQHTKEALSGIKGDRIKIIRVKNEDTFGLSKVWNFAISHTKERFILKIDADIILKTKRIARHPVGDSFFYVGERGLTGWETFGTILMTREMFQKSNGYNERLINWGYEDNDYFLRLIKLGFAMHRWSKKSLNHISHPDTIRLPKQKEENILISEFFPWTPKDTFYKPEIEYIA